MGKTGVKDYGSADLDDVTRVTSPRSTMKRTFTTLALGVLVTAVVFGGVLALLLAFPSLKPHQATILVSGISVHAVLMICLVVSSARRANTKPSEIGFNKPTKRLLHLLWQIPAVFAAVIAAQGIMFLFTGTDPGQSSGGIDSLASRVTPLLAIGLFVSLAVLTPIWEEILFRGLVLGAFRARFGRFIGVAASSLIFAVAHGVPVLLLYTLTLGVCLALLREFHGNLWGPIAMHVSLNGVASSAILMALT